MGTLDNLWKSYVQRAIDYYRQEGARRAASLAVFYVPSLLYHRSLGLKDFNDEGIDLFEQDWDNLIILDACRYDAFEERADLGGSLEKRISKASSTSEFVKANFTQRTLHDVVYVSSNPWYLRLKEDIGAELHGYYDIHNAAESRPHVDQMKKTTECAKACVDRHPDKRLLVHYAPPHHPLFGPTASDHLPSIETQLEMGFYDRIRRGDILVDDNVLRQAYNETLDSVLEEVEELLDVFEGKTVIAADHGEMLGERSVPVPIKYYGHVPGLYTKQLVEIPWSVHQKGERKEIVAENPDREIRTDFSTSEQSVEERLSDLGYRM